MNLLLSKSRTVSNCFVAGALLVVTGVAAEASPQPLFVDRAAEAGLAIRYFNGMTGELLFPEIMGGGAALFDFDRDGDLDIYLTQGEVLRQERADRTVFPRKQGEARGDRLLRNEGPISDGWIQFVDVTATAGIEPGGYGMGVAVADYDNDGWQDVYVLDFGPNRLWRNLGDGRFVEVSTAAGVADPGWSTSAAWFDYDGDGWLDLFVGNYVDYSLATHKPCYSESGELDYCSPSVYPPARDALFRNLGDASFERFTKRSGVSSAWGPALGAVTADFNADGRLDLYVANDGQPNQLWINTEEGRLVDESVLAGVAVNAAGQPEASMGVVAADFDDDGVEDLFMTHLTRETNTLYLGGDDGYFRDASAASGLAMASWKNTGFGVGLADFDLDGRLDLFVANGAVRRIESLARAGDPYPLAQPNQFFRGLGGGRFVDASSSAGVAAQTQRVSRGVAVGDVDNDGDPDLLVVNSEGPLELLENQTAPSESWLGVGVLTAAGAPALGVAVRLDGSAGPAASADVLAMRRLGTGGSYASAGDPRVVMAAQVRRHLTLRSTTGRFRRWSDPPVGRYLVVPDA